MRLPLSTSDETDRLSAVWRAIVQSHDLLLRSNQNLLRTLGYQALSELTAQFLCVRYTAGCFAAKKGTSIRIGDNAEEPKLFALGNSSRPHWNVATTAESIQEEAFRGDFGKSSRIMQERKLFANRVIFP